MSQVDWASLLKERDLAWDKAEEESNRKGNAYKNREGVWVHTEPKDMVGEVLRRYCNQKGLCYC